MLRKIVTEYAGLARGLEVGGFARYLAASAALAPQVLRSRNLVPVDRQMHGTFRFKTWRNDVVIDCERIDQLAPLDPTLMFSSAREMFGRNVYLRAFEPFTAPGETVLDLGGNRGLFAVQAAAAMAPARIVSVEPQASFTPAFQALNGQNAQRVVGFVGDPVHIGIPVGEARVVRIEELVGPQEQVAFLKIDIEGGEEGLFAGDTGWLRQVRRIAMEAHNHLCDTSGVIRVLHDSGFTVFCADHFGQQIEPQRAEFFYAARLRENLRRAFRL